MSVKDVIKSSFLKEFTLTTVDYPSILIAVGFALAMGILIALIYSRFFGGVIYSRGYAETLIGMSVLTAMVTLAISTNVVISLGMVGSLSIIRYRTAVKSPLDLLYMFWSVTVGITAGAHMYWLAVIASAAMFCVVAFFHFKPVSSALYVMVVHYDEPEAEEAILRVFGRDKYQIKSKTVYNDKTEMAIELFTSAKKLYRYDSIRTIPGVKDVSFIQYNGEYHG